MLAELLDKVESVDVAEVTEADVGVKAVAVVGDGSSSFEAVGVCTSSARRGLKGFEQLSDGGCDDVGG